MKREIIDASKLELEDKVPFFFARIVPFAVTTATRSPRISAGVKMTQRKKRSMRHLRSHRQKNSLIRKQMA